MTQVCKITKCRSFVEWENDKNIHYELREIHTTNMENMCSTVKIVEGNEISRP